MKKPFINIALTITAIIALNHNSINAQNMSNKKLNKIIYELGDSIQHASENYWVFKYKSKWLVCITDENHNRMRIISAIKKSSDVTSHEKNKCLEANFHTSLDTRYAVSQGMMYSAFIHPLKELTNSQVRDAISQVYRANVTFGSKYSSSNLFFNN